MTGIDVKVNDLKIYDATGTGEDCPGCQMPLGVILQEKVYDNRIVLTTAVKCDNCNFRIEGMELAVIDLEKKEILTNERFFNALNYKMAEYKKNNRTLIKLFFTKKHSDCKRKTKN